MIVAHIGKSLLYGATTNCILLASITLVEIVVSNLTSLDIIPGRFFLIYCALGIYGWFLAAELLTNVSFIEFLEIFASTMEQKILLGWILALLFWTAVCSTIWFIVLL